jgi:putative FmdB family regulatory protein
MPIYEYRCNSCGAEKEHLQKISDAPISVCPACGSGDYIKQISAAGFQLKGSGWYATDFKSNKSKQPEAKAESKSSAPESAEGSAAKESNSAPAAAVD